MEKKLNDTVAQVQAAHPQATVEVWSQDEARIGLFPILRRVWAERGKRPIALVQPRHIWAYVSAFVHPSTGRTSIWVASSMNIPMMSAMLQELAQSHDVGPEKQVVLVFDQAGWHMSRKLAVPEGIHIVPLPSHTPELQPTERIWRYVREEFANAGPTTRAELHERLERRCLWVHDNPEVIQAATHYHWWPDP